MQLQRRAGFFKLDERVFAIDDAYLRQVVTVTHITPIPRASSYLLGLIADRGHIVPLLDLRLMLLEPISKRTNDLAVVLEYDGERFALGIDDVLGRFSYEFPNIISEHPLKNFGTLLEDKHQTLLLDVSRLIAYLDLQKVIR